MGKTFSATERELVNIFAVGEQFIYNGIQHKILLVGKPRPSKGECKTDLFIKTQTSTGEHEFKISVKQKNWQFIENKINLERAIDILGADAKKIIKNSLQTIKNEFETEELVFFDKRGNTQRGSITLGWKYELLNCKSGHKAGKVELSSDQILNVYSGGNLTDSKKNCVVNDIVIANSGIANYMLTIETPINKDINYYASNIISISEYVKDKSVYFACKALNYRVDKNGWDGDRPLAVYANWSINNGLLSCELEFEKPLEKKGNEIGDNLIRILNHLNINEDNFRDLKNDLDPDIEYFEK